jgi:hypothetical protein
MGGNIELVERFYNSDRAKIPKDILNGILIAQNDVRTDARRLTASGLLFAWEDFDDNFFKKIQECVSDAQTLVVIGYSFPYVNREIDRRIIRDYMKNLKKVYFQSTEPDEIMQRFSSVRSDNVDRISIKDIKQFYIPSEL